MTNPTRLLDDYHFPGFRPRSAQAVHPTDPTARVIELVWRKKKSVCSGCGGRRPVRSSRRQFVRDLDCAGATVYLSFDYCRVACRDCGVKQETLEWLASSKHATQRFEDVIGRQCRDLPLTRVAELNRLTWDRVRRVEMAYMFRLEARHPPPESIRAIGIDEISVAKGQTYAIVVADLDQKRPIWMSREPGRTQADLDMFFVEMGAQRCASIRLAVMDMWKPFRKSTKAQAPNAQIVYDKFHVMTYLGDALDDARRLEFQNVHAEDRRLIKGQRYTLLSRRANLDEKKERALVSLLKANRRLYTAYLGPTEKFRILLNIDDKMRK